MEVLFIVLGAAAVLMLAAAWIFSGVVLFPPRKSLSDAEQEMIGTNSLAPGFYEALQSEEFSVVSRGLALRGEIIAPQGEPHTPKRVMVLVHGYGYNRMGEVKYIPFFTGRGFYVIIYDNRHSGLSDGKMTTMGHLEKEDLSEVITFAKEKFGADAVIGLHGESLGGATVLMNAASDARPDFVIADCPYASCRRQLAHNLKQRYRLPPFPMLYLASLVTKLRAGFFYKDASPEDAIAGIERRLPILFFHGTGDDFVPCEMTKRLYDAYKGPKRVYYGEGSAHTFCSVDHREDYDREIGRFLDELVFDLM